MLRLSPKDHQAVLALGLDFEKGNDQSKQVFIRDQLDMIFGPFLLKMRLHPHEVGIHPFNRDRESMTASGVWIRGSRVIASGFSFAAMGKLWAFEDHPVTKHISKHTVEATTSVEFGNFEEVTVKVGPANWTHCNQFVAMVVDRASCSHPDIPCIDGRIDSDSILRDPKNIRLSQYVDEGMIYHVFPSWVEEQYAWMPNVFQSACNQEQQVQEGTGFGHVYIVPSCCFFFVF
jgi:hypothetical protein